jgi:hypothetical protein
MKRFIGYTSVFGAILIALTQNLFVIPEIAALFPHLAELYSAIESAALRIIPDRIEEIVSAISDTLN